jgi:hypothetical protein
MGVDAVQTPEAMTERESRLAFGLPHVNETPLAHAEGGASTIPTNPQVSEGVGSATGGWPTFPRPTL